MIKKKKIEIKVGKQKKKKIKKKKTQQNTKSSNGVKRKHKIIHIKSIISIHFYSLRHAIITKTRFESKKNKEHFRQRQLKLPTRFLFNQLTVGA